MSISVGGLVLAIDYSEDANTILAGLIAIGALAVGWVAGAIRVGRIAGPPRLPEDTPILPFASILFGSFGFFVLAAGVSAKIWPWVSSHFFSESSETVQTEFQTAIVACVPPLAGLIAIWIGDQAILPLAGQKLGISARLLPRGILLGVLASLITIPVLFFMSEVADRVYRAISYQHDPEHPMLRVLGESPSVVVRAMLVIGACVVVPIWEEAFFRGHLQTLLSSALGRVLDSSSPGRHKTVSAWGAVILTSAMFAVLHPLWTVPIIFLLALGLGYAYERTGNLWVSIAMHATFNSISTFWFLLHGSGN